MSIKEMIRERLGVAEIGSVTDELEERIKSLEDSRNSVQRWITITNASNAKLQKLIEQAIKEDQLNHAILQAELLTFVNMPWYKMITRKQKEKIIGQVIAETRKSFAETVDKAD